MRKRKLRIWKGRKYRPFIKYLKKEIGKIADKEMEDFIENYCIGGKEKR